MIREVNNIYKPTFGILLFGMNSFKNMIPLSINYLPIHDTVNDNTFKYEIYKLAKEIAIMRVLNIEKN
jgi:hypothetical protein